ncbi:MAG: hypothetical protein KIS29_05235 [Thermoplasmata archaeon]|nr:hypothetical protein [Candidatus Sysuiplasma jiujiangense]
MGRIQNLPEFGELKNIIANDVVLSRHLDTQAVVGDFSGMRSVSSWDFISDILLRQLNGESRPVFNEKIFSNTYADWENFFYTDSVQLSVIAPISQFRADNSPIVLHNGVRIRRITDTEFDKIYQNDTVQIPAFERYAIRYVLEFPAETEKILKPMPTQIDETEILKIETFLRAISEKIEIFAALLRLYEPSHFGIRTYWIHHNTPLPCFSDQFMFGLTSIRRVFGLTQLNPVEIAGFTGFYQDYEPLIKKHEFIERAIRRFNESYDREKPEDAFLDLCVAIEILFQKSDESGENTHKISTRMAKLLSSDFENRKRIFKEAKRIYGERSSLVHRGNSRDSAEFVSKTADYVRKSIISFLDRLGIQSHDAIIDYIDLGN